MDLFWFQHSSDLWGDSALGTPMAGTDMRLNINSFSVGNVLNGTIFG